MIRPCKVDKRQLAIGTRIEMEHTDSVARARKIATDHLCEFRGQPYYTELVKMETKLKRRERGQH